MIARPSSTKNLNIPERMRRVAFPGHPQPPASPKLRAYALALGCSESVAETKVYGPHAVNLETAKIIEAMLQRGETESAAAFEAPILAALMGTAVPHWTEAIHPHNLRDATEDVAQAAWIRDSSDDALEFYIRSLATDIRHAERLLAALVRERDERAAR